MSISQLVAQHLPFLRRYARALTGSQKSGDTYVAAVLEALIEEPETFPGPYEPRVALYRAFTKVWNSLAEGGFSDPEVKGLQVEQRLTHLTPRTRQAFLLLGLEGFSEKDAADILDIDVATLRQYLDDAGRELAAEIATDVLIIEDVPLIAVDIESLVDNLGHKVVGIARTHREAVQIAKAKPPGVDPRRYSTCRRKLGARRRQRTFANLRGAGDFHHRLSRALPHRRAAGARVFDSQTVPAGDAFGCHQPGVVFRAHREAARAARELIRGYRLKKIRV